MGTRKHNAGGNPVMDYIIAFHPDAAVEVLLVASCYRNGDKSWPDGLTDSYADFTLPIHTVPIGLGGL